MMRRLSVLIPRFLKYLLIIFSLFYFVAFFIAVLKRISYPFEMEWLEGSILNHVRRILSGEKIYVAPSLEFIPHIYTPFFYYLGAFLAKILGEVSFIPLRLLSFLSTVGCLIFIFLIVKRETKNIFLAFLSSALFAATYEITITWFDLARVDMPFLFFLLVAIYLIRFGTSLTSYLLAGLFIFLSFLTKQVAFIFSLPLILYFLLFNRRLALFFSIILFFLIGSSTLLLDYLHQGWYSFYVFKISSQHPLEKEKVVSFWTKDLAPLFIALALGLAYIFFQFINQKKKDGWFYLLLLGGIIIGSYFPRLKVGGAENVLIPVYALLAILFGLGVNKILEFIKITPSFLQKRLEVLIYLVCLSQFALLIYNPFSYIPNQNYIAIIETIKQMEDEIFVPYLSYLAVSAGKKSYANWVAINDVLISKEESVKNKLINEIKEAFRERKFKAVVLILHLKLGILQKDLERYYREDEEKNKENKFLKVYVPRTLTNADLNAD